MSATWHIFKLEEARRSRECIQELSNIKWAAQLLKAIQQSGGVCEGSRPQLFEARFGCEILALPLVPQYEFKTGVGNSSIDFRIEHKVTWLIEAVCADETLTINQATTTEQLRDKRGMSTGSSIRLMTLRSDAPDPRLSEAWEMIKLQEKLFAKVMIGGKPHKFGTAQENCKHVLLVDARGFSGGDGPDHQQLNQLAYGAEFVHPMLRQAFNGKPINGLFDKNHEQEVATHFRRTIHCVIFVVEKDFRRGTFWKGALAYWNPYLPYSMQDITSFPWHVEHRHRPKILRAQAGD